MTSLLKGIAEEKVVLLGATEAKRLPFIAKGIVRLIDGKGSTLGVFLDKSIMDEIEEDAEASDPKFLASLKASRASGRVSGREVKKKLGMK